MERGSPAPGARRLDPVARFGVRATLLGLALLVVSIPFGLVLEQVTSGGPLTRYDDSVAQRMNRHLHDSPGLLRAIDIVSFTGRPVFLFLTVGPFCAWLLHRGARKLALFVAVTCLGGGLVGTIVKVAVARRRPLVPEPVSTPFGNSFPSGHAMETLVCYGAVLLVVLPLLAGWRRRAAVALYVAWCLAVGASRLALSVHFITDVVGGFLLGGAWLVGMVALFEIWREERGRRRTDPVSEGLEPSETDQLVSS